MARVFSGVQPSGTLHLGNYLGALRQWVADQDHNDAFYCIVDLHALTVDVDPGELRQNTLDTAIGLFAVGLDPERCTIFVQSHVAEHAELSWLLECTASYGELRRMTQFKEKGAGQDSVRAGLLTYPVLMASDIVLYDTDKVPVGDDQRQHLELARDLAIRFNSRYGDTFVVPEPEIPTVGARVMDLQHPERKMSKSVLSPLGTLNLTDPPDEIVRKVRRAVTDASDGVEYDPEHRPGVANLLDIFSAATGRSPRDLAADYSSYGPLKADVADALVALLAPVQERLVTFAADPAEVDAALRIGAGKARDVAAKTYGRARDAVGLLS